MQEGGKPTGITRHDAHHLGIVDFEGRRAQIARFNLESGIDTPHEARIELDIEGDRVALFGYFRGDEFMELERSHVD